MGFYVYKLILKLAGGKEKASPGFHYLGAAVGSYLGINAAVLKSAIVAALFSLLLFLPAILLHPAGRINNLIVVGKVLVCVGLVNIFNHTTQGLYFLKTDKNSITLQNF